MDLCCTGCCDSINKVYHYYNYIWLRDTSAPPGGPCGLTCDSCVCSRFWRSSGPSDPVQRSSLGTLDQQQRVSRPSGSPGWFWARCWCRWWFWERWSWTWFFSHSSLWGRRAAPRCPAHTCRAAADTAGSSTRGFYAPRAAAAPRAPRSPLSPAPVCSSRGFYLKPPPVLVWGLVRLASYVQGDASVSGLRSWRSDVIFCN